MTALSAPTAEEISKTHVDVISRLLDRACKQHRAETGCNLWVFTIDAITFLVEWLSLAEPRLTEEFLFALAERAISETRPQMDLAAQRVVKASEALFAALRARKSS